MKGNWVSSVVLSGLLVGCQISEGSNQNQSLLSTASRDASSAVTADCTKYLSGWSGLAEASFNPIEDPHGTSESKFFEADNATWVCIVDPSNPLLATGLVMGPLGPADFEDYYSVYTFAPYYEGMSPCDLAFDWADVYVESEESEEAITKRLLNSTYACRSVDEWWESLLRYPRVFGVNSLVEEDMWSYLSAVCPSGADSPVCRQARKDDLLEP